MTDSESKAKPEGCPRDCEVPEGVTLKMVPKPRHAWSDVVGCPYGDCERFYLVIKDTTEEASDV